MGATSHIHTYTHSYDSLTQAVVGHGREGPLGADTTTSSGGSRGRRQQGPKDGVRLPAARRNGACALLTLLHLV